MDKPIILYPVETSKLDVENGFSSLPDDWKPIWLKETHPYLVIKKQMKEKTRNDATKPSSIVEEFQSNTEVPQNEDSTITDTTFSVDEIKQNNVNKSALNLENSSLIKNNSTQQSQKENSSIAPEILPQFDETTEEKTTNYAGSSETSLKNVLLKTTEKPTPTFSKLKSTEAIDSNENATETISFDTITNEMKTLLETMTESGVDFEATLETSNKLQSTLSDITITPFIQNIKPEISIEESSSSPATTTSPAITSAEPITTDPLTTLTTIHSIWEKMRRKKPLSVKNRTTLKSSSSEITTDKSTENPVKGEIFEFEINSSYNTKKPTTENRDNYPQIDNREFSSTKTTENFIEIESTTITPIANPAENSNTNMLERSNTETSNNVTTTKQVENPKTDTTERATRPSPKDMSGETETTINSSEKTFTETPSANAIANPIKTTNESNIDTTTSGPITEAYEFSKNPIKSNAGNLESPTTTPQTLVNATTASLTNNRSFSTFFTTQSTVSKLTTDLVSDEEKINTTTVAALTKTTIGEPGKSIILERPSSENNAPNPEALFNATTVSPTKNRVTQVESRNTLFSTHATESKTTPSPDDQLGETYLSELNTAKLQDANSTETDVHGVKHSKQETDSVTTTYTSENITQLIMEQTGRSGLSDTSNGVESSKGANQTIDVNYVTKSPEGNQTISVETVEEVAIEEMGNVTSSFVSDPNASETSTSGVKNTTEAINQEESETTTPTESPSHGTGKVISETNFYSTESSHKLQETPIKDLMSTTQGAISKNTTEESGEYSYEEEEYED